MDYLKLMTDLHVGNRRQGPGGEAELRQAIELAGLNPETPLKIADIGCGTGVSTLELVHLLNAEITAVDFLPEFIQALKTRVDEAGVSEKITPLVCSMEELPFEDETFDVIWSEGAVYNMGFEKGIQSWRPFLKPGGILAVSEITWLTAERPADLQDFWDEGYPEINTASAKMKQLEQNGYSPIGYLILPPNCWLENYYAPLQASYDAFLARQNYSEEALAIIEEDRQEAALYEKYQAFYSYGFYIAQKTG